MYAHINPSINVMLNGCKNVTIPCVLFKDLMHVTCY